MLFLFGVCSVYSFIYKYSNGVIISVFSRIPRNVIDHNGDIEVVNRMTSFHIDLLYVERSTIDSTIPKISYCNIQYPNSLNLLTF